MKQVVPATCAEEEEEERDVMKSVVFVNTVVRISDFIK
jgi:hypothetical protein